MVWWPYHREQQVIAEIERLGGKTESEIVRPAWIPDAVDDEYLGVFARVFRVILDDTQINDAGLEHLHGPTNLTVLSLSNTQVSDAGFEHIQGLTKLELLSLDNTQISDAGLEHLRGLTNPTYLNLSNTRVTQVGIERLKSALPNCYIAWTPPAE